MFSKILVAIDGSPASKEAISTAIELARTLKSEVMVEHVHEHELGRAAAFPLESAEEAKALVDGAVKALEAAGIKATGEVHEAYFGHTARDIVTTAAGKGAELIVLGSRGLSDVGGLLLGSVTHKVMQLAHIPVLVVRGKEEAKAQKERVQRELLAEVPS